MTSALKDKRSGLLVKDKSYFTRFNLPKTNNNTPVITSNGKVIKSILRVKSQRESLEAIHDSPKALKSKRHSFGKSIRSSFRLSMRSLGSFEWNGSGSRKSILGTLEETAVEKDTSTTSKSTTVFSDPSNRLDHSGNKKVGFFQTHTRLYLIEPSDNPGISGSGPAIHLSWNYNWELPVSVDDYEAARPQNPPKVQDLKMSLKERENLLIKSGATPAEIKAFERRIKKAKIKRAQTVEELSLYGKANMAKAERRREQWESVAYRVKRFFRLRRTERAEQAALWNQLQQKQHQMQITTSAIAAH